VGKTRPNVHLRRIHQRGKGERKLPDSSWRRTLKVKNQGPKGKQGKKKEKILNNKTNFTKKGVRKSTEKQQEPDNRQPKQNGNLQITNLSNNEHLQTLH